MSEETIHSPAAGAVRPPSRRERARHTLAVLRAAIPEPKTELRFDNPYQLLVAVVLSAQCTDKRVNETTPALFGAFPTVAALAAASPAEVFPYIRSVSYPNNKAKHLVGAAQRIMEAYGGQVPDTQEELMTLPGVGRKTANVIASVAFDVAALAVDTHVFRVANRIGLVRDAGTPLEVEMQLRRVIPKEEWIDGHHLLILHGRYTCTARSPQCEGCPVAPVCDYYARLRRLPPPLSGLNAKLGRCYCRRGDHYFDVPDERADRTGLMQPACPRCRSADVYDTRTGRTLRRIRDYRVG